MVTPRTLKRLGLRSKGADMAGPSSTMLLSSQPLLCACQAAVEPGW